MEGDYWNNGPEISSENVSNPDLKTTVLFNRFQL
jgi:hypothetical protein